jgi:ankyrin repeat protein
MMHTVPVDAKFHDEKPASEANMQKAFAMQRQAIRAVVAGGADPNMLDSWLHETPLINALQEGHHDAALVLMDLGADVNKPDNKGNAPILFSVLRTWDLPVPLDVLQELLAHGADPNSHTKGADMMESLPAKSTSLLELLLEQHGIGEINAGSDQNLNEAVQLVLTHGAHFTGNLSPAVLSLLTAATKGDLPRIKQAVAQGASVNSADADGWTPLMIALSLGHEDCGQWLLAQSADVKTKNAQGYSPLFFAVIHQQEKRVADFLGKGANPNCGRHPTMEGQPSDVGSALWLTVDNKNVPIFKLLIDAGAKATPDDVDKAIQLGQVEMVRALLDKGSSPDSADPYEHRGSIYWAVYYHQLEILKLLLDHGADPEMKTDYDETPLSEAKTSPEMASMIKAAIAKKHGTPAPQ